MKIIRRVAYVIFFFCIPTFAEPSVIFFYGKKVPIPQVCMYDLIVVDPASNFNPKDDCKSLSEPIAYTSLGEVAQNAPYAKEILPTWSMGKNIAWNNNLVIDQTQPGWQEYYLDKIIEPLWVKGYRGFFLDTLDSYQLAIHDPKLQQHHIDAMASIIQKMKQRHPEAKIILNRGFQLLPQVHSYVYAVVIESLYHSWNQQNNKYEETPSVDQNYLFNEISKIRQMQLPIIVIDYLPPEQQKKAQQLFDELAHQGFIPWITDKTLNAIYIRKTEEIVRKVLIIFTDENKLPIRFSAPLRYMGTIIEYLGYVPKYINLGDTKDLPSGELNKEYAGIILWLTTQDNKNIALLKWAQKQIINHIPLIFFNSFGVPIDNKELANFGILVSSKINSAVSLQINKLDKQYIGHDTSPPVTPYDFFPIKIKSGQVLLQMKNGKGQTEDAVAITSWGGYALIPYTLQYLPNNNAFWVINPLKFFHDALRLQDFPIPDTTTENGRRLMTVHVDGDGFSYQAKWIGGHYAAVELRDKILKEFQIPTSISVITGEIAPNGMQPNKSPELMDIARSIFALPWVESASHSFSHPFYWQINKYKKLDLQGENYGIKIPGYKFNLETEITGSLNFINQYLVPKNRGCRLFFWSGLADPSAQALALTYLNNALNINGVNDTNINKHNQSMTGIRPMGFDLDGYYQVFAPIEMDFYFINNFAGPLYGFENVIETFKLTNKPRRFKPIDIYYHFYSASYPAALQALKKVYRWALSQPVMNIYISEYIKKVIDFYQITITKRNNSWIIYSNGDLRELRSLKSFGYPDLMQSQNIIGFSEHSEDLYIHIGPNRFTVLTFQKEKPLQPYLIEANARVIAFKRTSKDLMIRFKGYMPLEFTLANVSQCNISSQSALKPLKNQNETIMYRSKQVSDEIHINC